MKKISVLIIFFTVFYLLVSVFPTLTFALENPSSYYDWNTYSVDNNVLGLSTDADYKNFNQHNYLFDFTKDMVPGEPFYFLKRAEEGLTLALTFNNQEKEKTRLGFAGERLAEMQEVVLEGNVRVLNSLTRSYENIMETISQNLEDINNRGQDVKDLASEIDQEASRHNLVLEEVAFAAPEAVTDEIIQAISASELAVDTVADVENRPAVPEAVVNRLQATEALGILTSEEVSKVIDSSTRREARDELRKYVNADLFPEADFKKFDETSFEKYPQGFYTVQEIKKFQELKKMETEKPDDATIEKLQEFAKTYKAGEVIPGDLRQWWVPTIRLEELQNTIRPDLINQDFLRNRPDYMQKYQEVVERIKPTREDSQYVNDLINKNPNLLNDPSYARLKALSDKFGYIEEKRDAPQYQACGNGYHWAPMPFMPNGGYCVPNYQFTATDPNYSESPCPFGYHRPSPGAACYADNPDASRLGSTLTASGSCPSGYGWIVETSSSRGYCAPKSVTDGGFPSPVYTVGYCLPGQAFRDGKCETYNPPPTQGCSSGYYWNGNSCVQQKNCQQGYYQDNSGECRQVSSGEGNKTRNMCSMPPSGCGNNSWWDYGTCSCKTTTSNNPSNSSGTNDCRYPPTCSSGYYVDNTCTCKPYSTGSSGSSTSGSYSGTPSRESQEAACRAGGGTCTGWYNNACSCIQPTYSSGSGACGSGYYWNGNSCVASPSYSEPAPYVAPNSPPSQPEPVPAPQEPLPQEPLPSVIN